MLTPQDITSKEFTKAVFGGYDMASVDDFLDALNEDYSALYKENAILKNKLKVLVEKVEEYRSTEDSMRLALVTAQKMSKDMTDEAEARARSIVEKAEEDARAKIESLRIDTREEELRLESARARTAEFIAEITEKFRAHIELLATIEAGPAPAPAAPAAPEAESALSDAAVDETARSIEDSLARIFAQTANPVSIPEEEPAGDKPRFEFRDLQFGTNYENR